MRNRLLFINYALEEFDTLFLLTTLHVRIGEILNCCKSLIHRHRIIYFIACMSSTSSFQVELTEDLSGTASLKLKFNLSSCRVLSK